ncbi:MAG: RNA polymerase subunit sigma-24 [Blastocatellia bacterium AA13]|nr:MAG: RNA polymerase subunit sigma-24 [Blastocatellia bacterium AA13]
MATLEPRSLVTLEIDAGIMDSGYEGSLIGRLRAQELSAFEELVSHFERPVFSVCLRLLGDPEEARDAAQETFLKVYRGLPRFRGESGLKTWIYRIAVNQAMNQRRWWRRRYRDETISLELSRNDSETTIGEFISKPDLTPEERAIANEREGRLLRELSQMKPEYRAALVLREIEELSYEEIAETLQISIGTVKSRIARAREELRRRVQHLNR